jgi:hypothetical protein
MVGNRNSDHGRRLALRVSLILLLVLPLVAGPTLLPAGLGPFDVDRRSVALAFAASETATWTSEPVAGRATVAGLTWEDSAPEAAWIRTRVDGAWGAWLPVELDDEHVPDPGTREAEGARRASPPVIVEGSDSVQFKVRSAAAPSDLRAEIIETRDDRPGILRRSEVRSPAAEAATSAPPIIGRDVWGGDDCLARKGAEAPHYVDRVQVMFVHHTASSNDYSEAKAPGIVRSICEYHVYSNGWDDIGYNFLVDKYGNVYEGRAGGITAGVQGAHTGGFNSYSTGTAFIGTHGTMEPSSPAQKAFVKLAAWKLDLHHVDPTASSVLTSFGSSRYSSGTVVRMDNISGHRDASSTSCPGWACYLLLDGFRSDVRSTGGPKIFGGLPTPEPVRGNRIDGYEPTTFTWTLSHPAAWTFELLGAEGNVLVRRTGSGDAGTFSWDGSIDGENVPIGDYRVRITGGTVDGKTPRPVDHTFTVGQGLPPFIDDDNSVHEKDIVWIAGEGITKGCNPPLNDLYCPDDIVKRKQMAAFLVRGLGLSGTSADGVFSDVPSGSTFAADINKLATAGITRGCGGDRFCPDASVSREQMAAFIVRALGLSETSEAGRFRDVDPSSRFASDINKLATAGITKGCNPPANDRFCPGNDVTRAQMASFLTRALK